MNILYVCEMGQVRSRRAMELANRTSNNRKIIARCAGVSEVSTNPITEDAVKWADRIVCMEDWHKEILLSKYPTIKPIEVWGVR